MPRLLFEKTGNAIWISHLDLMRVFQRSFQRAELPLTHTKGFNPRPSVSIALPMSVGIQSHCELLDFDLEGEKPTNEEIRDRLNEKLIAGVRVLEVYDETTKIKNLALLSCRLDLEYDSGIPENAPEMLRELFTREEVVVEKHGKNKVTDQNIIPMIRKLTVQALDQKEIRMEALICCQNPTLNPMQIPAAIEKYLPQIRPDFVTCCRMEIYDQEENIFR